MRLLLGFMLVVCLVIGVATSGFGSLVVVKSDSPGSYDATWSDCTFSQALKELHDQFDLHSFAQILDKESNPESDGVQKELLSLLPITLGHYYRRDFMYVGTIPVFYPFQLPALRQARDMVASQLITSLTPKQLKMHKSKGFLPFTELNDKQRERSSYLARTVTPNVQYPEPELSEKLWESAIIVTMTPMIYYEFDYIDEQGRIAKASSSFSSDRKVSEDFLMENILGQIEAYHLNTASITNPGMDVPGDSTVISLDGTYTLAELLRKINGSSGSIQAEGDPNKIRIEAHCDMTAASLARACGIATGMDWQRQKDGWRLAVDSALQSFNSYGRSVDGSNYTSEYEKQIPAMRKIAYQGNMVLVIDQAWNENFDLRKVLDGEPILWTALTPDQQAYLKSEAAMFDATESPTKNVVANLPKMKLSWHPNIKMYIVTKDGALYDEWLRF